MVARSLVVVFLSELCNKSNISNKIDSIFQFEKNMNKIISIVNKSDS